MPAYARQGAKVVLRCGGEDLYLMQHRSADALAGAGQWTFPGGMMEPGESARHAAWRELLEETDIVLLELDLRPHGWFVYTSPRDGRPVKAHVFHADFESCRPVQCYEGESMQWLPLEVIRQLDLTLVGRIIANKYIQCREGIDNG